jgi:hypothetical protein
MIDCDSALSHHFFQVTQAQRIGHIPAYSHQDYIERVMQAFQHARYSWVHGLLHRSRCSFCRRQHSRPPYCDKTIKHHCRRRSAFNKRRILLGRFVNVCEARVTSSTPEACSADACAISLTMPLTRSTSLRTRAMAAVAPCISSAPACTRRAL